ncbi:MAG: glycosyltransferase family 2 protein [archaeon]|nr:glycosyltransferase family 2 protein [archaeon]
MDYRPSRLSLLILIISFSAFYLSVELLLIANRGIFGPQGLTNTFEIILISFLNFTPAGIFAFAIVSVLPKSFASKLSDETIMSDCFPTKGEPRVAALYVTFNDFIHDYAVYNLGEARRSSRVFFILDDSTDERKRAEIDSFARDNECKVLRRNTRDGYKAGAINSWLRRYSFDYDYIFVLDSDSQASHSAIDYCVGLARRDPKLAVIQTKTMTMTSTPNRLTKSGVTIQHAYMAVVQAAMKNLGTSPFYGHNALLKIEALESVGGLIEESNEDYKTLARLHNKGYESIYASNAVTYEEIPPDYFSSRKRALRWARDAVGQLGLLRYKLPGAMRFYLIYGWITYMANIALLAFFLLLAYNGFLPMSGGTAYFTEIAGIITMSVVILWPLLSLRTKDPELTPRKIVTSVAWGSLFNTPMMGPISAQIAKTIISQLYARAKFWLGYCNSKLVEEFVVTPKVRTRDQKFLGTLGALKAEIIIGALPLIVAIETGAAWYLLFSSAQLFMLCSLPVIIFAESTGFARSNKKHRKFVWPRVAQSPHLRGSPFVGNVPPSIQTEPLLQVVRLRVL